MRSITAALAAAVMASAAAPALRADITVVPSSNGATLGGSGATSLLREAPNDRTLQFIMDDSLLGGIPAGSELVGISFRLRSENPAIPAFPPASVTFPQFNISIAHAATTPATFSTTFATNVAADDSIVRSGPLTLGTGYYPGGAVAPAVNVFSRAIAFTTPFIYLGGSLVVTIRLQGHSGATSEFIDSIPTNDARFGVSIGAVLGTDDAALTGIESFFPVTRFTFRRPPAPAMVYAPAASAQGPLNAMLSSLVNESERRYHAVFSQSELQGLPAGSELLGVAYRADSGAGPIFNDNFMSYIVSLGVSANPPSALSTTFASNIGPDLITARGGSLHFDAGDFPAVDGSGTAPFGPEIPFTNRYLYKGGDLLFTVSHSGHFGVASTFLDSAGPGSPGFGTTFNAVRSDSLAALVGFQTIATAVRFRADTAVVVPPGMVVAEGSSNNSSPISSAALTVHSIISRAALREIPVGSTLTGLSWRIDGAFGAFPTGGDAEFTQYDILVGTSLNPPASMDDSIAANIGADGTIVRSGPLVIPQSSFPAGNAGPTVRPYGPVIRFTTPFIYKGGDLAFVIRHSTHNRPLNFLDAIAEADPAYGELFRQRSAPGAAAFFTSNDVTFPITRIHFIPGQASPASLEVSIGSSDINTPLRADARTYQILFSSDDLALRGMRPGSVISALSWRISSRLSSRPTWPDVDADWTLYDMQLSTSPNTPATMSNTFASNIGGDVRLVRSGALRIGALAMDGDAPGPGVNHHTFFVEFSRPYTYNGGPLCVTLRHTGNDIGETLEVAGVSIADPLNGTAISARSAVGSGALVGAPTTGAITRFVFLGPAPCSADVATNGQFAPPFTPDGILSGADFDAFILAFFTALVQNGVLLADIATTGQFAPPFTPDGILSGTDFDTFILLFFTGC